jgi:TPR repeat protein
LGFIKGIASLFSTPSRGILSSKDEYYIERLATLENQIQRGDDFYGAWLSVERDHLLKDADYAIPNVILGLLFMNGINVEVDLERAQDHFNRSIDLGSNFAYKYLGVLAIRRGHKGVGHMFIEKGAGLGDPEAMMMLGVYYVHEITDDGGEPDYKKARQYFSSAARMGHDRARQNLAAMDARGL